VETSLLRMTASPGQLGHIYLTIGFLYIFFASAPILIFLGSFLLTIFFTGEKKIHYRAQDSQFNARQAFFYCPSGVKSSMRIH
jgi:hypothetical protein